jgi:hypothetical protein
MRRDHGLGIGWVEGVNFPIFVNPTDYPDR